MAEDQSPNDGEDIPVHGWRIVFVVVAAVLVFCGLLPASNQGDATDIARFLAVSYALLVAGMILIWAHSIPHGNDKNVDHEALARDRLKATVAILIMVTMLGVVTLITYAIVTSPKQENKTPPGTTCCPNVVMCANSAVLTSCPCTDAPSAPCAIK